ncbi:hypothetical protein NLJ89_g1731 [Agrocybe chaxingu]|uniref:Uncharacterized protein n=1 Tax=Agrocybe chaxingu TaxID=84603 RepID=A0A9W8MZG9_9AGAR|nr:hypothetical protein NLJ89_g1731 [Agrocybe chaxingu]
MHHTSLLVANTRRQGVAGKYAFHAPLRLPVKGSRNISVGDLQVNIEDDKPENDNIHNEPASASPPQPSHTPSEICVFLAALHREDPRRANAAFNDYRRTHPARAGELFSILVHGTMEQWRLGHFFYWELSARDDIAALDLLERSLRVHLGISQLPRPLDVRISIPCLLLIDGLQSLSMMFKELFKVVVRARG